MSKLAAGLVGGWILASMTGCAYERPALVFIEPEYSWLQQAASAPRPGADAPGTLPAEWAQDDQPGRLVGSLPGRLSGTSVTSRP